MGKRGPKPWAPNEDQIAKIKLYAGLGSTQQQIASMIGISVDTLQRCAETHKAWELGQAETIARVAGTLVKKALAGDTASAIFYLKTQAGWRETVRNEHTGADGGPIQHEQVKSDAASFRSRLLSGTVAEPATEGTEQTQH